MVGQLSIVTEWLPEEMEPGSIFVLENAGEVIQSAAVELEKAVK